MVKNLSMDAYEQIKNMIFTMQLRPGESISEEKISELLNCSRTPVREALRQLANEGLVQIHPQRQAKVSSYDKDHIRHIGVVRLEQDILSGRLAVYYGSNADFLSLREYGDCCEKAEQAGNLHIRVKNDIAFHLQIAYIGKNEILIRNQENLYQQIYIIEYQLAEEIGQEKTLKQISHHQEIIQALIERDFDRYQEYIIKHIQIFYDIDPNYLRLLK